MSVTSTVWCFCDFYSGDSAITQKKLSERNMTQRVEIFCGFWRSLILYSIEDEGDWVAELS